MVNFAPLLKRMSAVGVKPNTNAAREWFRKKIRETQVTRNKLTADSNRSVSSNIIGSMYCYYYDPKTKDKLPYYDEFPLIFVVDRFPGGFLGINLHYVSPKNRILIMEVLSEIANNKKYDSTTKLDLSYQRLKALSKFNLIKPCVKKYLNNRVKGNFVKIEANEWDIAIFLPVQKFKKAAPSTVWSKSAQQGR